MQRITERRNRDARFPCFNSSSEFISAMKNKTFLPTIFIPEFPAGTGNAFSFSHSSS